jgi:hypothetical protein
MFVKMDPTGKKFAKPNYASLPARAKKDARTRKFSADRSLLCGVKQKAMPAKHTYVKFYVDDLKI